MLIYLMSQNTVLSPVSHIQHATQTEHYLRFSVRFHDFITRGEEERSTRFHLFDDWLCHLLRIQETNII